MVTQKRSSCQDGDPEQPGKGPGGKQDEAAEQAGSQVMMMVMMMTMIVTRMVILLLNHAKLFHGRRNSMKLFSLLYVLRDREYGFGGGLKCYKCKKVCKKTFSEIKRFLLQ